MELILDIADSLHEFRKSKEEHHCQEHDFLEIGAACSWYPTHILH